MKQITKDRIKATARFVWYYLKGYRKCVCVVSSYGTTQPMTVKCIAQNEHHARLIAKDYIGMRYGSSFVISRIEVKVDKWGRFDI